MSCFVLLHAALSHGVFLGTAGGNEFDNVSFTIQARDRFGNNLVVTGANSDFTVRIVPVPAAGGVTTANVQAIGNGQYFVWYNVPKFLAPPNDRFTINVFYNPGPFFIANITAISSNSGNQSFATAVIPGKQSS